MMVHLTKEKSEVSWGGGGEESAFILKTSYPSTPQNPELFCLWDQRSHTLMFWESQNPELIRWGSRDPRT